MSGRLPIVLTVAAAALAAAGGVVGITLATRDDPPGLRAQPGRPPIPASLPGPVGAAVERAFAHWPHGSITALEGLARAYPRSPEAQLYVGIGLLWAGYTREAAQAFEQVKRKGVGYDTRWELAADNLLHPEYFTNDPVFTPTRPNALLEEGSRLQAEGHQHSAERLYERAARAHPNDPEAQVAAAVGLFDKDDLTPAFARLGPLARRFPRSQVVRFYLGLLLAWTGQRGPAVAEFERAIALGPTTPLGQDARQFVERVGAAGTAGAKK